MKNLYIVFSTKNRENMGKIHKNFFATAFCAAFLFLMSFSAFGQTITIQDVTAVNENEVLIGGITTDIADYTTLYAYYGTENNQSTLMMGNSGEVYSNSFQINVTGLQPSTTYYFQVRDDATGTMSNIYELFQTAGGSTPTVITEPCGSVLSTEATLFGTVTPYSSTTIDKVGFIYSTDPAMLEMMVQQISTENTMVGDFTEGYVYDEYGGQFKALLDNLTPNTDYYVQACVRYQGSNEQWIVASTYETFRTENGSNAGGSSNWITIGGGPGNNTNLPVNIYYKYSLSQQIYTPAEIGRAGTIERVAFYNNTDNIARTIDLYMFTSDRQSFTSTTDWETVSSSDRVFSGEVTFLSGEWTEIPLTNPFEYDGAHNIIIVTDDNTAYDATTQRFLTFEASGQSIYVNGDDTDFDPTDLSSTTAIGLEDVKNQIKLGFTSTNPTFEYVDLGLPSGTKWATMNIGAERPEDFGTYFAWGETSPKTVYDWESYIYADGDSDSDPQLTKYCNDSGLGITDALTELETGDDAATAILGSNWRMPTYDEVIELRDYCEHVFTTQNGVAGTLVTGPNNQSIFIPAAAGRYYNNLILSEGTGSYWSSSLDTDDPTKAQGLSLASDGFGTITSHRYFGLPIRPVYDPSNTANNQTDDVLFQCDFEDDEQNSLWSLNTTSQTNYWHIGSAVSNGGSNALYITNDGDSHQYDNTSTSYSYATIQVWIGEADNYQFDFDWMANAENDYDNMRAFLVSLDAVSSFVDGSNYGMEGSNNTTPTGWIDLYSQSGIMVGQTSWQHNSMSVALEEGGYNLVFFWKNDSGDGNNPPAAVDNIVVSREQQTNANTFTDTRDGQTYSYVTIGDQTWMAENLRYAGNIIIGEAEIASGEIAYLYYPNGDEANAVTYGYLYNWPAAMDGESSSDANPSGVQGICPNGWHLPSEAEWTQLIDYLGGTENAGAKLAGKSNLWESGALTQSEYFGSTRFEAVPAGMLYDNFSNFGNIAFFWSATQENSTEAYFRYIYSGASSITSDNVGYETGLSVRCIKNAETVADGPSDPTDYINGYGYVDLGLPSGTMWATMNVGANSPEDGGKHYAWGETQHKETYDWTTYSHCNGSETSLTKYCSNSEYGDGGITDDLTVLEAMDDAAVANWGEGWRLPTQIEMQELVDNCDKTWTTYNGVAGMLFTSRNNGNSIFLPDAGLCTGSDPSSAVSGGYYWSSSLDTNYPHRAWDLYFGSDDCAIYYSYRIYGQSVRAVYKADNTASNISVTTTATYNTNWQSTVLTATISGNYDERLITEKGFNYGTTMDNIGNSIYGGKIKDGLMWVLSNNLDSDMTYYYNLSSK